VNAKALISAHLEQEPPDAADRAALETLLEGLPAETSGAPALRELAATLRKTLEQHSFALVWISALDSFARRALAEADRLEGRAEDAAYLPDDGAFQLGGEPRDPFPYYATLLKRRAVRLVQGRSNAAALEARIEGLSDAQLAPYVARLRMVPTGGDGGLYSDRISQIAVSLLRTLVPSRAKKRPKRR
jgi:hypothetical protein